MFVTADDNTRESTNVSSPMPRTKVAFKISLWKINFLHKKYNKSPLTLDASLILVRQEQQL